MRDPLTDLLLRGAHQFSISACWVVLFVMLSLLMIRSLGIASQGNSRHHPLVWLVLAIFTGSVLLMLWGTYQPDLTWGLMGLGIPTFGVVSRIFRPRPRRFRSWC